MAIVRKKLIPKADWVVGEQVTNRETQTAAGLWVPEKSDSQDEITVVAVGPDVVRVKPGDIVIFVQGRSTKKAGTEQWLIKDTDIIATVERSEG